MVLQNCGYTCFFRTQKKEHVDERLLSAYDLMNQMVAEHAPKRAPLITQNSVTNSQRKTFNKTTRVKVNNRYKENKNLHRKKGRTKPAEKTSWKSTSELYNTRTIPSQARLTRLNSLVGTELGVSQNGDLPKYDYDVEESAKQFITRKSYESYQKKMSASFDFDRSISSLHGGGLQHSLDPRVDELLEDVSLGDPLNFQRLGNLDSILSGDSELRDLLNDVIENKQSHGLLETRDDAILGHSKNMESRFGGPNPFEERKTVMDTFKVDRNDKRNGSHKNNPDILSGIRNTDDE